MCPIHLYVCKIRQKQQQQQQQPNQTKNKQKQQNKIKQSHNVIDVIIVSNNREGIGIPGQNLFFLLTFEHTIEYLIQSNWISL